jgi:hypothetical protein
VSYLFLVLEKMSFDSVGIILPLPSSDSSLEISTPCEMPFLFLELDRMSFDQGRYHPTILTGDLNSNTKSEVYRLITQGTVYLFFF